MRLKSKAHFSWEKKINNDKMRARKVLDQAWIIWECSLNLSSNTQKKKKIIKRNKLVIWWWWRTLIKQGKLA